MSQTNNIMNTVKGIFSDFLSQMVPKSISNILWNLFNGTQAVLEHLEWKVDTYIRENNILTATHKSSLRSLAAQNGYEPTLKIPSQGLIRLNINQSLYNSNGYPLYILPYSEFKCKANGFTYYYNSDKPLKLTGSRYDIPVVEGVISSYSEKGTGETIQRVYLKTQDIANNSIIVKVGDTIFKEVKSFFDNQGLNDDKQYIVKFSHNIQKPLILYIKGVKVNETININYRSCYGAYGNLSEVCDFETNDIINYKNEEVSASSNDISIKNVFGFTMGSDGSDINALKSAIGFNHGSELLFDNISYRNFIDGFSTLVLQKIENPEEHKSFNYIYLYRRQNMNSSLTGIKDQYQKCIRNKQYILSDNNKKELSQIISKYEYCLTTHKLFDPVICKFAFQIKYETLEAKTYHQSKIDDLIYTEFAKFLKDKYYSFNFEDLISNYEKENDIKLESYIFKENDTSDSNVISATNYLPLLQGDFYIETSTGTKVQLFTDINHVIND